MEFFKDPFHWEKKENKIEFLGQPWTCLKNSTLFRDRSIGLGLFADRNFQKGECVGYYEGVVISKEEAEESESDKLFELKRNGKYVVVDGQSGRTGWVQYMNDARGSRKKNNCRVKATGYVLTTRFVRKGQELLFDYGEGYWS
jgi:hypothetical protein